MSVQTFVSDHQLSFIVEAARQESDSGESYWKRWLGRLLSAHRPTCMLAAGTKLHARAWSAWAWTCEMEWKSIEMLESQF